MIKIFALYLLILCAFFFVPISPTTTKVEEIIDPILELGGHFTTKLLVFIP